MAIAIISRCPPRALNFPQINIDLIAGMLGETEANWRDCIERTLALEPDKVTIYRHQQRPAPGGITSTRVSIACDAWCASITMALARHAMFRYRRRVQFAETDAAGMVHFSVFFRYMEEAEHAVWQAAGMDIVANHEERSWPRISAHFDFKAPLRFQDDFEVRTEIAAVSRSTIQWAHVVMRGDTVIGTGAVTAVYVAKNGDGSMKSTQIPEDVISRLRAALAS